ncbi:hypothetical protein MSG28_011573 [Choristoneura fumiferana]|uniref:Uncharacterized protein n=1 Tax=Choristoneura fumiferana TaxID=7141 RepID=A0ACC0JNU8_CHOFU|nr:hypothetical protein MSG28_011573 [Choristoneura fumiferana]
MPVTVEEFRPAETILAGLPVCHYQIIVLSRNLHPYKHYLDKVRCTRRYSVGECPEPVVPVWTYVAHLQNCTERLGCHSSTISNRFATLAMCMERCRSLKDLYTLLIAETNLTDTGLRSNPSVGRRDEGLLDTDYPAPAYPAHPNHPQPAPADSDYESSDAPAQFHTVPVTQEESYGDAPPEVEFWEG